MKKIISISLFCLACIFSSHAQDTLSTVDGHKYAISSYSIDFEYQELNFQTIKGKKKSIDLDNAFSIKSGETEKIVYPFDPAIDSSVTIYDLRQYMSGSQLAVNKYKGNGFLWGGIAAGTAGLVGFKLCGVDNLFGVFVPAAYVVGFNYILPSKKLHTKYGISDDNQLQMKGFYESVQHTRFKKTLIGSGIGIVTGFLICNFIE